MVDIDTIPRVFFQNFTDLLFISQGRMTTPRSAHENFEKNFLLSSLSLLVKSIDEEIQLSSNHVDTVRGWIRETLKDSSKIFLSMKYDLY